VTTLRTVDPERMDLAASAPDAGGGTRHDPAAVGAGEEEEFGIFVRDDAGRIVAGASGSIWGGCCQIHTLWVDGPHRGHGLATQLMTEAEATARRRGCRLVMGLTYDVLTSGFYDRLGYRTVGTIEDCPAGTTTRWYRKDL